MGLRAADDLIDPELIAEAARELFVRQETSGIAAAVARVRKQTEPGAEFMEEVTMMVRDMVVIFRRSACNSHIVLVMASRVAKNLGMTLTRLRFCLQEAEAVTS